MATIKGLIGFISILVLTLVTSGSCWTVHKLDSAETSRLEGFLKDGVTSKDSVLDRLGKPNSSYENERILIYHVNIEEGRMRLDNDISWCHACVMVFDDTGILERHSLVLSGCSTTGTILTNENLK